MQQAVVPLRLTRQDNPTICNNPNEISQIPAGGAGSDTCSGDSGIFVDNFSNLENQFLTHFLNFLTNFVKTFFTLKFLTKYLMYF